MQRNDVIGSIILCAYAQFYAIAIFVIDRLDTPERGGSTGSSSLSMTIFLKIFSSCLSCPSWRARHTINTQHLTSNYTKEKSPVMFVVSKQLATFAKKEDYGNYY